MDYDDVGYYERHHCPTCDSPAPHLHPAVQFEGEVQPCSDDFHQQDTPQNRIWIRTESDQMGYDAINEARKLLGQQVEVYLGDQDKERVVSRGKLLAIGEGGDFEILDDNGLIAYCWPMLGIRKI